MASSVNFTQNSYAGEVLEDLLTYTAQGNDTYKEGLIHIKTGITSKFVLPSVSLSDIIQDNKPTPVSPVSNAALSADSQGQYTFRERCLEPQDFMIYLEFNPRDFEKYWRFMQPQGNLIFRDLDPKLQAKMLQLIMDKKNEFIGDAIWQSVKGGNVKAIGTPSATGDALGSGVMKYFDGVVNRIMQNLKDNVAGETVILAGNTEIGTGEKVETALYTMWKKCPKQIRKSSSLVFVLDYETWDLYDQYLSSKPNKNTDNTKENTLRFKGKRVVPVVGIPAHTIVLSTMSTGVDSNLWMGVDYSSDEEAIKIDKLQNNSELYFFQMRMKMDVNIVRPAEIVVWTSYTLPTT